MPPEAISKRFGAALLRTLVSAAALLAILSCSTDPAERDYLAALRGEEEGMTREQQLALLDRAIALEPRRAWYRETHAIYCIDLQRFETAAADIDSAIALADRPFLRFLRGLVACQRGEYEASLSDFELAIAGQPENSQFYRGRSLARSRLGQFRAALEDAERLRTMAPQQAESHYAVGVALTGLGRVDEAVRSFDVSTRQRPELIYPLLARAEAYRRLGDWPNAAADSVRAEEMARHGAHAAYADPFRY